METMKLIWKLIFSLMRIVTCVGICYTLMTAPTSTPELLKWIAVGVIWTIPMNDN